MALAVGQFTIYDFHDVYSATTPPTNPQKNQVWLDTSIKPPVMKVWNGTEWAVANDYVSGGTNLLLKSRQVLLNGSDNSNQGCSVIEKDYVKITPKNNGNNYGYVSTSKTREKGVQYTISFEIITPNKIGFYWYPSETYTKSNYINPSESWQKVQFTYTQTGDDKTGNSLFGLHGLIAGSTYLFKNLQLETGNRASDWKPAPEDVEEKVVTLESKVEVHADAIQQTVKKTEYNGETVVSMINQTAENIKISAKNIELNGSVTFTSFDTSTQNKITTIENTANSASTAAGKAQTTANTAQSTANTAKDKIDNLKVGGRNIVYGSNVTINTGEKHFNFNMMELAKMRGQKVTLSVYVELQNAVGTGRIGFEPSIMYEDGVTDYLGVWRSFTSSGETIKTRIYKTFTLRDVEISGLGQRGIYIQNLTSGTAIVGYPKFELGTVPTDYTVAPEDIDTELNNAHNAASNAQSTANSATKTANTASQNATNAVTTANSASSTANTAKTTADSAKSTATSAQGTANTANANATNAVNTANNASSVASAANQNASTAVNTANSANSKIDNLEIGGRNLARLSDRFSKGSGATGITSVVNSDNTLSITAAAENGNWFNGFVKDTNGIEDAFNEGDNFTISFLMSSSNTTKIPTVYIKQGMGYYSMKGALSSNKSMVYYTGTWKKTNGIALHLGFSGIVGTIKIHNWKIEKGSKPTAWTRALEDVSADINTAQNAANNAQQTANTANTNANTAISTANTANSNASTAIGTANTANTNASNAVTTANKANSTASSANTTAQSAQSTANTANSNATTAINTANNASSTAQSANSNATTAINTANTANTTAQNANSKIDNLEIGGTNLIRNTKAPSSLSYWVAGTGFSIAASELLGENVFKVVTTASSAERYGQTVRYKIEPNTTYTFSADVYMDANVTSLDVFFLSRPKGNTSDYTNIHHFIKSWNTTKSKWVRIKGKFITKADDYEGYIRIDNNGSTNASSLNGLWFTKVQLEKGAYASDWSICQSDVDTTITTAQNAANNAQQTATSAQSTANTASSNASSALSTANTAKSTATSAQNTANTANTNATNAINTANNASSAATTATNTANTANTNASNALSTANSANSKIDNLEIGGRNLFMGYDDREIVLPTYQNKGSFMQFRNCLAFDPSETVGEQYVISFYAKSPNGSTPIRVYNANGNPRYFGFNATLDQSLGNEWRYYTYTFTNKDSGSNYSPDNKIEIYASDKTGVIVKKIQIEKGNRASDWKQSQEDVSADINTAQNAANNAQQTATTANTNASNAVSTANTAKNTATSAQTTANTANTNASNAVTTANNANKTAGTANTNATNAVNTANNANSTATTANNTANAANTTANNASATAINATQLATAMSSGKMLYKDSTFKSGTNNITKYNNSSGSTDLTVTRIARISDCPSTSNYCMEIKVTGANTNPSRGGFYFGTKTRANARYLVKFIAKIPTGYTLGFGTNDTGTGGTDKWFTSNVGTGTWTEYIHEIKCGSTGTFSTTAYYYLSGGSTPTSSNPLVWYLSYATVFDVTDTEIDYDTAINTVQNSANNAQSMANSANTAASNAQSTANTANTNAQNAQNTANKAQTSATNAQNTANNASSAASNAQSTANSAQSSATTANNKLNTWSHPTDKTTINGGKIYTGSITAAQIAAGAITANMITSGTFKGVNFEAGGSGNSGSITVKNSSNALSFMSNNGGTYATKIGFLENMNLSRGSERTAEFELSYSGLRGIQEYGGTIIPYEELNITRDRIYMKKDSQDVSVENGSFPNVWGETGIFAGGALFKNMRTQEQFTIMPSEISVAQGEERVRLQRNKISLRTKDNNGVYGDMNFDQLNEQFRIRIGGSGNIPNNGLAIQAAGDTNLLKIQKTGLTLGEYNSYEKAIQMRVSNSNMTGLCGMYLNTTNFGLYDWQNSRSILQYNQSSGGIVLGGKNVMFATSANGYYGLAPNGSDTSWVRTTSAGIIPYRSGGGGGSLGTDAWWFDNVWSSSIRAKNNVQIVDAIGTCYIGIAGNGDSINYGSNNMRTRCHWGWGISDNYDNTNAVIDSRAGRFIGKSAYWHNSSKSLKSDVRVVTSETMPMALNLREYDTIDNHVTMEMIEDFLDTINIKTYVSDYNQKGVTQEEHDDSKAQITQLGYIADEFADHPLFPYIGEIIGDYHAINTTALISSVIAGYQSEKRRRLALEENVKELESRLSLIEEKLRGM